ncbi:deoxynucleotidyltransferase terminal-interacting protein 2 isoform X2 [Leuresthes tenuis]|uniref:deoxynucleotidyltransferase terminal-interacting protein 2 isoform X2 n=1 Tax=Leuresthes tenuis TaxID=355514 RepID=UPI003B5073F0
MSLENKTFGATPFTGRRTRNAARQEESSQQHAHVEIQHPASPLNSTKKRCTRASRLHSPEQPSTPVSSIHEADMSDLESCCSAVSEPEPPLTRTRRRTRQPRAGSQADDEISEVESCSSAISATKPGCSSRRSTRKKAAPESSDKAQAEEGGAEVDVAPESEPCSSGSQRVTRSQRKIVRTRSSAKQQTEDSELSEAESCTSSASRRRSRRQIRPIPMRLDELSESSQSPAQTGRRTRAARGKARAILDVNEPPSCDSEGFESGSTYSLTTCRRTRSSSAAPKAVDSDSEVMDVHSPVGSPSSTRGRGTPSSSRTGSGTSSRGAPASRRSAKDCTVVEENTGESAEEDKSLNDSKLENTVIAVDADCTLLEEHETQASEEQEGNTGLASSDAGTQKLESEMTDIAEEISQVDPSEKALSEPAVTGKDQQEEPSAENNDEDTSEMEVMQETIPPSEPSGPCPSVTVTICEKASEEKQEAADLSQADKPLDADVEIQLDAGEKMEVGSSKMNVEQVADTGAVQTEPIQVTSRQQHKVTVDSDPEQQSKDVVVQSRKIISLLDSSDDEEDFDEEEREVSDEEDFEHGVEEGGEPSNRSEAAGASVQGLFMIDPRPGQDADQLYYREGQEEEEEAPNKRAEEEEEEEDEEFVDEDGDDDDDDEDAKVLFSSRNSHLKELSSRIDPGIRVKELGGLYISFDGSKSKPVSSSVKKLKEKKIQEEAMKKSVIGPDFEKKDAVPPYSESKQALKLKHKAEREKTTGDGWFNMKAPEITQELKEDLHVLKMRRSLDPKRFYKKNDRDGFPKYFQVGTVVDSPVDFYHSRVPKKERKRTMVEELLADADFRHQNKKRYQHIMTEKAAQGAGRRNKKKKNKFQMKKNLKT